MALSKGGINVVGIILILLIFYLLYVTITFFVMNSNNKVPSKTTISIGWFLGLLLIIIMIGVTVYLWSNAAAVSKLEEITKTQAAAGLIGGQLAAPAAYQVPTGARVAVVPPPKITSGRV